MNGFFFFDQGLGVTAFVAVAGQHVERANQFRIGIHAYVDLEARKITAVHAVTRFLVNERDQFILRFWLTVIEYFVRHLERVMESRLLLRRERGSVGRRSGRQSRRPVIRPGDDFAQVRHARQQVLLVFQIGGGLSNLVRLLLMRRDLWGRKTFGGCQ